MYKKEIKNKAIELYGSGLSARKIETIIGVDDTTVSIWIRQIGITRSQSESHKGQHNSPATQFKKGIIPWITGKKRWWKSSGDFKKGRKTWNRGLKICLNTGRTHFKKGLIPWNFKENKEWKNNEIRSSYQYKQWRRDVYIRDEYTCQKCGHRFIKIVAHHIKGFADYPDLRFDLDNGRTLCRNCHCKLHKPIRE